MLNRNSERIPQSLLRDTLYYSFSFDVRCSALDVGRSSFSCILSRNGHATRRNFHSAIPDINITGVIAIIMGLRLNSSPIWMIT
jgi:hypothetical protein